MFCMCIQSFISFTNMINTGLYNNFRKICFPIQAFVHFNPLIHRRSIELLNIFQKKTTSFTWRIPFLPWLAPGSENLPCQSSPWSLQALMHCYSLPSVSPPLFESILNKSLSFPIKLHLVFVEAYSLSPETFHFGITGYLAHFLSRLQC